MKENRFDAALADLASKAQAQTDQVTLAVAPTEAMAQRLRASLSSLLGSHAPHDVICFPSFAQTGVFRFESARRVLALRLAALGTLNHSTPRIFITTLSGYLRLAPLPDWIEQETLTLTTGMDLDPDLLLPELERRNFVKTTRVEEIGEYGVRGSIVDLWPPGYVSPLRLEFFGDALEKIRRFRPDDQRSYETLEQARILPTREFVWETESLRQGSVHRLNDFVLKQRVQASNRVELVECLQYGFSFPGIDDYAPVFAPDHFGRVDEIIHQIANKANKSVTLLPVGDVEEFQKEWSEIERLYQNSLNAHLASHKSAPALDVLMPQGGERLANLLDKTESERLFQIPDSITATAFSHPARRFRERLEAIQRLHTDGLCTGTLILCRSVDFALELLPLIAKHVPDLNRDALSQSLPTLNAHDLASPVVPGIRLNEHFSMALGDIESGFFLQESRTLVISSNWLQGASHDHGIDSLSDSESRRASREASVTLLSAQFSDLVEGEFVVHIQHGIAKFCGLVSVKVDNTSADFLMLEYAGGDRIYVPVSKMNMVHRYMGAAKSTGVTLDSLKKSSWEKRQQKAKEDAEKLAQELLAHQAKRETTPGHAFTALDEEFFDFESAFPYDETDDQVKAIREIMQDMSKPKAMDRLLVGDVGFGKTEVAMRAAMRAVLDGKQVAWLVPTTVLAHQHFRTMQERFTGFGVSLALLDRSLGTKGSAAALQSIASGQHDIIVGTHRLLSKDLVFRDLGLLVVDEEHRFGVLQKERIKTISYGVDTLTMTATPIPRTLQMAMVGLRDLSLLTTPPKARLAVKTFVSPYDEEIIREAIESELQRGGQIFFVHNHVEDLTALEIYLQKLVPAAKIAVGHGKMDQKVLDNTIIDFIDQKYNLLLCTTIIESGIDMPNVNTIIIQDADQFGLAQLYQLRGRVGRRSSRGYAYFLMTPGIDEKGEGMQRLDILKEHQELGSGFVIASHDLEMRGAGNILGDEQSGHVSDVGLETYTQMLDHAIRSQQGMRIRTTLEPEINIPVVYQIPDAYIQNSKERLKLYRRFFGARDESTIAALLAECADRFGPPPLEVQYLAETARIRRWLVMISAASLVATVDKTEIKVSSDFIQSADGEQESLIRRVLELCNQPGSRVRMTPDGRITLPLAQKSFRTDPAQSLLLLKGWLARLADEPATTL
jgi:transcription-repair coupling factor (superfamily II helicase)